MRKKGIVLLFIALGCFYETWDQSRRLAFSDTTPWAALGWAVFIVALVFGGFILLYIAGRVLTKPRLDIL